MRYFVQMEDKGTSGVWYVAYYRGHWIGQHRDRLELDKMVDAHKARRVMNII